MLISIRERGMDTARGWGSKEPLNAARICLPLLRSMPQARKLVGRRVAFSSQFCRGEAKLHSIGSVEGLPAQHHGHDAHSVEGLPVYRCSKSVCETEISVGQESWEW